MRVEELAKTLDYTVLSPRATQADVARVCEEARDLHLAAVCAFPSFLPLMAQRLHGCDVKVCTVVAFPHGAELTGSKVGCAERAVSAGADELDVVMNVPAMLSGEYRMVRDELVRLVRAVRARAANDARGDVMVKVIIEAPYLTDKQKRLACRFVAEAGADFAKTATGMGTVATVHDVELMRESLPGEVGVKAAGGIRTLEDAESMINAGASRLGSSSAVEILREHGRVNGAAR